MFAGRGKTFVIWVDVMFSVLKILIYLNRTNGYRYYGKRSVGGYGDLEELEAIQERVSEMFHRASQIDGAQCVRRLICEVNAGSRLKYSVGYSGGMIIYSCVSFPI